MDQPTIYDVAEAAGVSISSVSRVLNQSDTVNDRIRERVLAAIGDLNYQPNRAAQLLARGRLGTQSTEDEAPEC